MIHKVMRKKKPPLTLSETLQEWKRRIADYLGIKVLYQSEAAALVDIPEKTWKNYEPTTRRTPGALALGELTRRLDDVANYCRQNGSDDSRLNQVIKAIQERNATEEAKANSA